jgi:hypothetical protein
MAYVKRDLESIGGFDVTHRAAGDDVDVCWKLLVREKKIAFSPAAFVWHRRRSSVRAYLKQQRGYGYAEAHLHAAYPSRFNVLGHSVWRGSIYDSLPTFLSNSLPVIFRPRIYQGFFGGAMFQSMYQPRISSWFTLFKSIEWQIMFLCVSLSGILGFLCQSGAGWLVVPGLGGLIMSLASACYSGLGAAEFRQDQWHGIKRILGTVLVALLHLTQPWARFRGRLIGSGELWSSRRKFPEDQRLWGNMQQRDVWLRLLWKHLDACGWICEASGEWADTDLVIKGPGFYEIRVTSVYEEILHRGFHWMRYRIEARRKPSHRIGVIAVLCGVALVVWNPVLLPMLIPLGGVAWLLIRARRHTLNAISQAALECGTALDMPEVEAQYQI